MLDYKSFILVLAACIYFYQNSIVDPNNAVIDQHIDNIENEYDFIIVGGGSAGCVLAGRLSEIDHWKILLLEAGSEQNLESQVPALATNIGPQFDWHYSSIPQKEACQSSGGVCGLPRGKILGGTSSINAMAYLRGTPKNYDDWEQLGNPGWGWLSVKKYFKKSENNTNPQIAKDVNNHNINGQLTVSSNCYETPFADALVNAGKSLGLQELDLNGDHRVGIMKYQGTIRDGKRCSTNKAFLQPARNRVNLHVGKMAMVTKINFQGRTATGVSFDKDGKSKTVNAKKEIIISAGSYNSPQLLMLSGVGPREHLHSFKIPVVADLPVGLNLQDHVAARLSFQVDQEMCTPDTFSVPSILDYAINSKGPLTLSYGGFEAFALVDTNGSNIEPDAEITFSSSTSPCGWTAGGFPTQPRSRGTVKLSSTNPYDKPIIDSNFFHDVHDREVAYRVIDFNLKMAQSSAFYGFNPKLLDGSNTRCPYEPGTREFFVCLAKEYSGSLHHPVGTCSMSPTGVVNHELKIHGLHNIRVVDGSIIPKITSTNTNGPIIMVAEKASDLIKNSYGYF